MIPLDPGDPRMVAIREQFMNSLAEFRYPGGCGGTVRKEPGSDPEVGSCSDPPSFCSNGTVVLVGIGPGGITISQAARLMESYRSDPRYSGFDIVLDGDRRAIVARPRAGQSAPLIGRLMLP